MSADNKYIVFKRDQFFEMMGGFLPKGDIDCAPIAAEMVAASLVYSLDDAVVIRTQDPFAGPALHGYAAGIALFVRLGAPDEDAQRLQSIADYFHERAVEADEAVDSHLPD